MRPNFITNDDIARWDSIIEQDEFCTPEMKASVIFKEVCYSGLWLSEELAKLQCPDSLITRMQYSAGKDSFGREPWEIVQKYLEEYKNNKLILEDDDQIVKN